MELSIFSRNIKNEKGRNFVVYSTKLTDKQTGDEVYHSVKFREECGSPDKCPVNIIVNKDDCNIAQRKYTRSDGSEGVEQILWIKAWSEGAPYVDHSTDRFF